MELPANLLQKYLTPREKAEITEYQWYVNEAAKMTGFKYIVMHKRLERAFAGCGVGFVLARLRDWVHEAEKHPNPAMIINARLKQYRERQTKSV